MFYVILRWVAGIFLRRYFGRIWVYDLDRVPMQGPLIVASNHPSAFLEASLLATQMKRPLHFLVRGDMFHPRFRWLFDWTNQIPIYRQKDGMANLRKNASSFDLTYRKLGEGHAVLIFPEAKTLLEKRLRPIQRGTAHLAFGSLPYIPEGQSLQVLPVGVNYIEPRQAGTDVLIRFGEPFVVAAGTRENRDTIEEFTAQLEQAMKPLVVQVDEPAMEHPYEVLASVHAAWMAERAGWHAAKDLDRIAAIVNAPASNEELLGRVNDHLKAVKKSRISEAVFFPKVLTRPKVWLGVLLVLKALWLLAGGWIWRLLRNKIFSKIKAPTFQAPTAIGASIVVFSLIGLVGFPAFFMAGHLDSFLIWVFMIGGGWYLQEPLGLLWRAVALPATTRKILKDNIRYFRFELSLRLDPQYE